VTANVIAIYDVIAQLVDARATRPLSLPPAPKVKGQRCQTRWRYVELGQDMWSWDRICGAGTGYVELGQDMWGYVELGWDMTWSWDGICGAGTGYVGICGI
jgi:hypothetical protein